MNLKNCIYVAKIKSDQQCNNDSFSRPEGHFNDLEERTNN